MDILTLSKSFTRTFQIILLSCSFESKTLSMFAPETKPAYIHQKDSLSRKQMSLPVDIVAHVSKTLVSGEAVCMDVCRHDHTKPFPSGDDCVAVCTVDQVPHYNAASSSARCLGHDVQQPPKDHGQNDIARPEIGDSDRCRSCLVCSTSTSLTHHSQKITCAFSASIVSF